MQKRRFRFLGQFATLTALSGSLGLLGCSGATEGDGADIIDQSRQELAGPSACPAGYEIIQGGPGADVIDASAHTNSVCILGNGGDDIITGGSNADWIAGGLGNDTINGGPGADILHGEDGNDTLNGGDADDQLYGEGGNDTMNGDNGADYLVGASGADNMSGGAGDDQLYGQDSDDTLHGDDGTDRLFGGGGNDTLEGGNGNDRLQADDGNDHLWGDFINNATPTSGTVIDTLYGGIGDDDLHGGPGDDIMYGDDGSDTLAGDDGDDRMAGGGGGIETMSGGPGNDLVKGGNSGSDVLDGNDNNDVLTLAATANGGNGTDACTGGSAASCELPEPATFCTSVAGQCGTGKKCALEVNMCIVCQHNSECPAGQECVPTVGCTGTEVVCNDSVDNDGDGQTDCADTDCAQDIACQSGVTQSGNVGTWHNCVTTSSGGVKCWGRDHCNQLGFAIGFAPPTPILTCPQSGPSPDPNCPYYSSATPINYALTNPQQARGGMAHTCVMLGDGTVQCFGKNDRGQLGKSPASTACSTAANAVTGLSGVTQLAAAGNYNCALLSNGTVKCWGENIFGQLGNGTGLPGPTAVPTPVTVSGLSGVAEIKLGAQHACARLTSGAVRCWGRNHVGQLGNSGTTNSSVPVSPTGLGAVAEVSVGAEFTCARKANGTVFCWGVNLFGQLGNGTVDPAVSPQTAHSVPAQVPGIADAIGIGSGWYHTCIKRATQGLRCWGRNGDGQIGIGSTSTAVPTPSAVNIFDATQFSMGQLYTCVRRSSGSLSCWGDNAFGEIGDGTVTDRTSPVTVPNVP